MLGIKKTPEAPALPVSNTKLPKVWLMQYFSSEICNDQNTCGDEADPDHDGLTNYNEFKANTMPTSPDTDSDGLADGDEINIYKTDPTLQYTDPREIVSENDWTDGFQIKGGYDPLTPGLKFTDSRKQQIEADTLKFPLHEPTISSLGQTQSSTANWKVYSDSYGFEVKTPADWKASDVQGDTAFYSPTSGSAFDMRFLGSAETNGKSSLIDAVGQVTKQTINGVEFSVFVDKTSRTHYETKKGTKVYNFEIVKTDNKAILLQILSTFKFTK